MKCRARKQQYHQSNETNKMNRQKVDNILVNFLYSFRREANYDNDTEHSKLECETCSSQSLETCNFNEISWKLHNPNTQHEFDLANK